MRLKTFEHLDIIYKVILRIAPCLILSLPACVGHVTANSTESQDVSTSHSSESESVSSTA